MRNPALPADTTIEAARVHFAVLRRLGIEHSMQMAMELSDTVRHMSEYGIRLRNPEYSEEQVRMAAIRLRLGDALFSLAYPAEKKEP